MGQGISGGHNRPQRLLREASCRGQLVQELFPGTFLEVVVQRYPFVELDEVVRSSLQLHGRGLSKVPVKGSSDDILKR